MDFLVGLGSTVSCRRDYCLDHQTSLTRHPVVGDFLVTSAAAKSKVPPTYRPTKIQGRSQSAKCQHYFCTNIVYNRMYVKCSLHSTTASQNGGQRHGRSRTNTRTWRQSPLSRARNGCSRSERD